MWILEIFQESFYKMLLNKTKFLHLVLFKAVREAITAIDTLRRKVILKTCKLND